MASACGGSTSGSSATPAASRATSGTVLKVVAAENFWGSLATQLGGEHVKVNSIITSPDTDPHDYEPTPADARDLADARYVISNGLGYDPWVDKALDANPAGGRTTLKVQELLGLSADDNPHRWYSPPDVAKVIDKITADYKQLDPADAAYFDSQRTALTTAGMKTYTDLINQIRTKYAGTPVGATESIVSPLTDALGLTMKTPAGFLRAISEGTDPTGQDKTAIDSQIANREIKVLLFNTQNATPDVQQIVDGARAAGIEIVDATETLDPPDATFQAWQTKQLQDLDAALGRAIAH
jgi:zinc/manganese transport system substrate-binding protein